MKNMPSSKCTYLIYIYLILQFIIDITTFLGEKIQLSISTGIILRSLFLVLAVLHILFNIKFRYKRIYICQMILWIIYVIGFFYVNVSYSDLQIETTSLFKSLYFIQLFLALLILYFKNGMYIKQKYIVYAILGYSYSLLLAFVIGYENNSYAEIRVGSSGFFNSPNEVGTILAMFLPIVISYLFKNKSIINWINFGVYFFSIFYLGTKTPILALLLFGTYHFIRYIILKVKTREFRNVLVLCGIVLIGLITFIWQFERFPIDDTFNQHNQFLIEQDNGIDSVEDITSSPYILINEYVFSQRLTLVDNTADVYNDADFTSKAFGIGYAPITRYVEIDFIDFLFHQGFVFLILSMGTIISTYFLVFKSKKYELNKDYIFPFILTIAISMFSGHVFTAPAVSTFAALIFVFVIKKKGDVCE